MFSHVASSVAIRGKEKNPMMSVNVVGMIADDVAGSFAEQRTDLAGRGSIADRGSCRRRCVPFQGAVGVLLLPRLDLGAAGALRWHHAGSAAWPLRRAGSDG
jgi:hypothetical protein